MVSSRNLNYKTLAEREKFIVYKSEKGDDRIKCDQDSLAGAVSQRACVYCGARVVLNPITDAYHLVHGPIGCSSYTWDIRGSLSSGSEIYRNSFSTDLRERDIVFGGEKKLAAAISEIMKLYQPPVIFVYSTCVVGVIGDDLGAICKKAEEEYGIPVIPVEASGFAGNKSVGYRAACEALLDLMKRGASTQNKRGHNKIEEIDMETDKPTDNSRIRLNILGDFNLAGETWILENYLRRIGVMVNTTITGDSTCEKLMRAPTADLNIVQCAGSMVYLARKMEEEYGIPYQRISFVGLEDTMASLRKIANFIGSQETKARVEELIEEETRKIKSKLQFYRRRLEGKKAAIYVGGGFKAVSLIKQFNGLGIETVMVGTQTGNQEDYEAIKGLVKKGTVILDDANPTELEYFMKEYGADILVGGVKERPLAYKLGVAFCDHNHERQHPLTGFVGAVNFAREIDQSVNSPVWRYLKRERRWS